MTIKKEDYKWLRCASLEHMGFLPGMPWLCSPYAHERLFAHGFIERMTVKSLVREIPYIRAVITEKGRDALAEHGRLTIEYLATTGQQKTPPAEEPEQQQAVE